MFPDAPYDLTPYPHIWDCHQASVDRRHLFWMFDILCAGGFRHALEIGCLNGASSTAFVEAINREALLQATFCDIDIRPTLRATLDHCRFPDRVRTFEGRSGSMFATQERFDFVFVDGDHRLQTVLREVDWLLECRPVCVMAHNTNAQAAGFADCEGPPLLKWRFQVASSYLCLEDNAVRESEATQRGMFLATRSREVFEVARRSLERWGEMANAG